MKFEKVSKEWKVSNSDIILSDGYIWLEFYPYNCNYCYTAMFDSENNIIEWYIDITKTIEEENDKYIEDLFIDFVLLPNGEFFILDEDELEDAYSKNIINEVEYKMIISVKEQLTEKLQNINMIKFLDFTNRYKEKLMKKYNVY